MCNTIIIFFMAMCLVILANGFLATANPQYQGEQRDFEHSGNKNLKSREGMVSMDNIIVPLPTNDHENNIIAQYVYKGPVHKYYNCSKSAFQKNVPKSKEFWNDKHDGVVDTRENQVELLEENDQEPKNQVELLDLVKEPQRTNEFDSSLLRRRIRGLPDVEKQTGEYENDGNGRSGILENLIPAAVEITGEVIKMI